MSAVTDLATDVPPATVLIVDDDPLNRAMLSMSLGSLGHHVIEAGNGLEGIAALGTHDVDVVITDIEMPEMDGYGLLAHRAGDDRLKAIPFIVISGVDEMESIITCIKLGAEDYLPKPFDPVLLHARLGACLDKKRMTDELQQWNLLLADRVDEKVAEVERLNMLRRFVTPQLAEALASGGEAILASHRREITVLFCDLRGFTAFAETAEPEEVMDVLREFHHAVGPMIFEHDGTIAQFTGDGMLVFFNDPDRRAVGTVEATRARIGAGHRRGRRVRHLRRDRFRRPHGVHGDRHRGEPVGAHLRDRRRWADPRDQQSVRSGRGSSRRHTDG
jgi:adenylate cyclase